jgi:hypothetical protein
MATKKTEDTDKSTQDINFDAARETARINHENDVKQNTVDGNEGVEVREGKPVEVINPVRNQATGELEDDTRTLKQSPEEALGVDEKK